MDFAKSLAPLLPPTSLIEVAVLRRIEPISSVPSFFSLKSLLIVSPGFRSFKSTITEGSEFKSSVPAANVAVLCAVSLK
ncbi:hypothetical protein D3C78_1051300 [compost metagenome]